MAKKAHKKAVKRKVSKKKSKSKGKKKLYSWSPPAGLESPAGRPGSEEKAARVGASGPPAPQAPVFPRNLRADSRNKFRSKESVMERPWPRLPAYPRLHSRNSRK